MNKVEATPERKEIFYIGRAWP